MHRVLSIPMGMAGGRGFGEPSEFVTKRMCFSFIFFIGFLALIGGFLLGKITTERITHKQTQKCNDKHQQDFEQQLRYDNTLLQELRNYETKGNAEKDARNLKDDYQILETELSNLSLFDKIKNSGSSLVATLFGSTESDRWIVVSVSGDGVKVGFEVAMIFAKWHKVHNWKPQRTIKLCFFNQLHDSCLDDISKYLRPRVSAYLAVHGDAIQKDGCLVVSGSDIIGSLVLRAAEELVSKHNLDEDGVLESCSKKKNDYTRKSWLYTTRLASDLPHASISFATVGNYSTGVKSVSEEFETLRYRKTLVRIIAIGVFDLSKSEIIYWDTKDFVRNVETGLEMINSSLFHGVENIKAEIAKNLRLISTRVSETESRTAGTEPNTKSNSLTNRMSNDLLMDLDRALLCPDVEYRSKTDLFLITKLLETSSQDAISLFLRDLLKCYEDAQAVLQQG